MQGVICTELALGHFSCVQKRPQGAAVGASMPACQPDIGNGKPQGHGAGTCRAQSQLPHARRRFSCCCPTTVSLVDAAAHSSCCCCVRPMQRCRCTCMTSCSSRKTAAAAAAAAPLTWCHMWTLSCQVGGAMLPSAVQGHAYQQQGWRTRLAVHSSSSSNSTDFVRSEAFGGTLPASASAMLVTRSAQTGSR